jgi:hypothetical protein
MLTRPVVNLSVALAQGRRNAFIAAAIAIPVAVVVAFVLAPDDTKGSAKSNGGVLPAITVNASTPDDATLGKCAQLLSALPVQIDATTAAGAATLAPRRVIATPANAQVLAWGDPAVVLICGVSRPAALAPNSSNLLAGFNDVFWLPTTSKSQTVFTTVDRSIYIQVTVPSAQDVQPLPIIATAVAKVLPPVCQVQGEGETQVPTASLCTHRP